MMKARTGMRIAIAGGHGKIGLILGSRLVAKGHSVSGLIRNPEHAGELEGLGVTPVLCDLEMDRPEAVTQAIRGADAVVFAAGAGPGSGPERKLSMDRDGAIKLLQAAEEAGIDRYVMVSAMGADEPPDGEDTFSVYLRAKADADAALRESGLDWTIVRPGRLTDDPPTGAITLRERSFSGQIPRADVAEVLELVITSDLAVKRTLYLNQGPDPIPEALRDQRPA